MGAPILVCQVGGATVALPANDVAEVVRVPACTRVPNGPAALVGVANLRGAVLPVVSLARLLGETGAVPARPAAEGSAAEGLTARMVVMAGAAPVGLLVDAVAALSRHGAPPIDLPPLLARAFAATSFAATAFAAIGGRPGQRAALPAPAAAPAAARQDVALISLRLADQEYAIPLAEVTEIIRVPATLAVLPQMDGAMLGVAAVRGVSLPVASLRALLGLPPGVPGPSARILVLPGMGVLVDSVGGILAVPADAVDPVPPALQRKAAEAEVQGICRLDGGKRLVCLLSAAHLVRGGMAQPGGGTAAAPSVPVTQVVVFRLGAERYGLPAEAVDCVLRQGPLTRVPGAPDFVAGVMTLRGRAIPVIDLSLRFGAAPAQAGRHVMVATVAGLQAGLAMDAVLEVLGVPDAALRPAPAFGDGPALFDRAVFEPGEGTILLVSAATLLHEAERDMLAAWSAAA